MYVDVQIRQMNKFSEELCGDSVGWHRTESETVLVLADGLGSGVKANILSTITQRIALLMFKERLPIDEVVETIASTLPVCKVRHMAYSTFTLIRIASDGATDIVEYDNPPVFIFRGAIMESIERTTRSIGKLTLTHAHHQLRDGDTIVVSSDGLLHAGLVDDKGAEETWSWKSIGEKIQREIIAGGEAGEIASALISSAKQRYKGQPRDDVSVAALKCRPLREIVLAAGPPAKPSDDSDMARRFIALPGKKIICGGTLARIMSRELDIEMKMDVDASSLDSEIPPSIEMKGIDLVTEGVITLMHAIDELEKGASSRQRKEVHSISFMYNQRREPFAPGGRPAPTAIPLVPDDETPAQKLASHLRLADRVTILLGKAANEAHVGAGLPIHLGLKSHLVQHLAQKLRERGKIVEVISF